MSYVVQDENLLGYLIRGSIYTWMDGTAVNHPDRQRPATLADFESFRVCPPPDMN